MNTLHYKGYTGLVELDEEAGTLFGTVSGLNDVVTFQGATVPELVQAFHDSVEDYLTFCATLGREPEQPYSGRAGGLAAGLDVGATNSVSAPIRPDTCRATDTQR